MIAASDQEAAVIRGLNDRLRQTLNGGRIMITQGVLARGSMFRRFAVMKTQAFRDFTPENDPHGEHDFGSFELQGETLYWKIDYYDRALEYGSPDPADPEVTTRVLTIMLAEER